MDKRNGKGQREDGGGGNKKMEREKREPEKKKFDPTVSYACKGPYRSENQLCKHDWYSATEARHIRLRPHGNMEKLVPSSDPELSHRSILITASQCRATRPRSSSRGLLRSGRRRYLFP